MSSLTANVARSSHAYLHACYLADRPITPTIICHRACIHCPSPIDCHCAVYGVTVAGRTDQQIYCGSRIAGLLPSTTPLLPSFNAVTVSSTSVEEYSLVTRSIACVEFAKASASVSGPGPPSSLRSACLCHRPASTGLRHYQKNPSIPYKYGQISARSILNGLNSSLQYRPRLRNWFA